MEPTAQPHVYVYAGTCEVLLATPPCIVRPGDEVQSPDPIHNTQFRWLSGPSNPHEVSAPELEELSEQPPEDPAPEADPDPDEETPAS